MLTERDHILAEKAQLEELLREIPAEFILDRKSCQSRIEVLNQKLKKLPLNEASEQELVLTFSGEPVAGNLGISAGFGSEVISHFTKLVAMIAVGVTKDLKDSGRIPDRATNDLLISGTVPGSFGFAFREPVQTQHSLSVVKDRTPVSVALELTQNVIDACAEGDDEKLADAISDLEDRVVSTLEGFLDTISKGKATLELRYRNKSTRFNDYRQIQEVKQKLSKERLSETVTARGTFLGVLPNSKDFEFVLSASGEVIKGKCSLSIENPEVINNHLEEEVEVQFHRVQVRGGKPKYRLLESPWS